MSDNSKIHWTESTWNPIRGCTRVSPGCQNCYAERMAARFSDDGYWGHGFAERTPAGSRWTGKVKLMAGKLDQPIRWRKPRMIFVNSTSDLFHEDIPDEEIAAVFGVMATCPQHTFQILTKRAERMRRWFEWLNRMAITAAELYPEDSMGWRRLEVCARAAWRASDSDFPPNRTRPGARFYGDAWPLPNVWLGISAESQEMADERITHLTHTPAAVRFVSAEPLLGPINLLGNDEDLVWPWSEALLEGHGVNWVITGGESGPAGKIRPADPDWFRSIRDQCARVGVPYFHKQNGGSRMIDGAWGGRELDGRTHDAMPGK